MSLNLSDFTAPDGPHYGLTAVIGIVMAIVSLISWCYSTFETKDRAIDNRQQIEKRLDRIDSKIDVLLTR